MKFIDIQFKRFSFQLKKTFHSATNNIINRESIIIKAIDEKGIVHYAEISPLPNFSSESIEEVETILSEIIGLWNNVTIEEIQESLIGLEHYPSLKYGFEQLLFSYNITKNKQNFGLISLNLNGTIGLLTHDEIILNVQELVQQGFTTIKIKIGRKNIFEDLSIVNTICSEFPQLNFRLDNNGNWALEDAIEFISHLSGKNIEYIEQPVMELNELYTLAKSAPLPLAADECIKDYNTAIQYINSGLFNYLVLKPSIRLGFQESLKIIEYANNKNVKVIITSAFETIVGRIPLFYLASLTNHKSAHGLNLPLLGDNFIRSNCELMPVYQFRLNKLLDSLDVEF